MGQLIRINIRVTDREPCLRFWVTVLEETEPSRHELELI
jgi:hypothetical protein